MSCPYCNDTGETWSRYELSDGLVIEQPEPCGDCDYHTTEATVRRILQRWEQRRADHLHTPAHTSVTLHLHRR